MYKALTCGPVEGGCCVPRKISGINSTMLNVIVL
jgi:hypothetical protein